ncbi:MAG: NAD(P)H-dependent oxidoreductase subunit E, partial [Actinomycetota bacterium]
MDIRLMAAEPTAAERAAVDDIVGAPESGWDGGHRREADMHAARDGRARRERRHLLLPVLHSVQGSIGWISEGALSYLCERLSIPPAEAYGVATFYAMFSTSPRPKTVVHVCDDVVCRVNGATEICAVLERTLGPERSANAADARTWMRSPCLGMCERAPAAFVQSRTDGIEASQGPLRAADVPTIGIASSPPLGPPVVPHGGEHAPNLLRRVGVVDPESLDDYRAHGGYDALRIAIERGPAGVVREVTDAKLLGRGGAAFPTGVKWEAVAGNPTRPHYFVCNADESEPGTFKDRIVMEADPFAVIEALTIAGYATGSEKGFLYVRGEYPLATARLERAIEQARAHGLLGNDVAGAGFWFDIELRRGAGAYIAGEETALFNSIEGKRAEPRNKPPFPVTHGLFGKPTGINNVETLINVLEIMRLGAPEYAKTGTADSTGTRLFCVSGCVERPGLYEAEMGTTLGTLIEHAGGVRAGRRAKALLLGGAAGSFVAPDVLDLRLTFEDARAAGV